jgi:pyruvate/2-oxoglutarate dehydrogenase complex dihydrolipoamide acyltransferase (E2) component
VCSCPPHDCARPPGRSNAPASGTVTAINVAAGDSVQRGAVLVAITKGDNDAEAVAEQRASLDNIRADLAEVRENVEVSFAEPQSSRGRGDRCARSADRQNGRAHVQVQLRQSYKEDANRPSAVERRRAQGQKLHGRAFSSACLHGGWVALGSGGGGYGGRRWITSRCAMPARTHARRSAAHGPHERARPV